MEAHGFYFGTLRERRPELNETLVTFREMLEASQGSQDSSKLKVWALQDLGLQAAERVLKAKEPLRTLRELCQNFPFVARSLSKSKTPRRRSMPAWRRPRARQSPPALPQRARTLARWRPHACSRCLRPLLSTCHGPKIGRAHV